MTAPHLWIRAETRSTEQRAPIVPADAARLVGDGVQVTVEDSEQRAFAIDDYVAAGCEVVGAGTWADAPESTYVVGIKELPESTEPLRHRHVYFAHALKGQQGADDLLERFRAGGGRLLDIEYLTVDGRRVVAFGRWAGYVGAALGVLALDDSLMLPLEPTTRPELDARLREVRTPPRALTIGALGRSGRGALEALEVAGATTTRWDRDETEVVDHAAILDHDLLVNCIVTDAPGEGFVRPDDLAASHRLRMVADVTCDVTSAANRIPVNTAVTSWEDPVRQVADDLGVIAVDNLPSLLPIEASESFSAELTPLVADLAATTGAWAAAASAFDHAVG